MPKGSIVSIFGPVADDPQLTEILWDGQTIRVFASDLEARSTTVEKPIVTAATDGNAPSVTAAVKSETQPGEDTPTSDAPVKVRRFTASGREL